MARALVTVTDDLAGHALAGVALDVTPVPSSLLWSDLNTWDRLLGARRFPTINDDVVLPHDAPLLVLDVDDAACRDIMLHEEMIVEPGLVGRLSIGRNFVLHGGWYRPRHCHLQHLWPSIDESLERGGNPAGHPTDASTTDPGFWNFHGVFAPSGDVFTPLARLAVGITTGDTLTLDRVPVGWWVGADIVIAPSEPATVPNHFDHFDVRQIASISGNTVRLNAPVSFPHPLVDLPDGTQYHPAVVYLSARIQFHGTPTGRIHMMHMPMEPQTAEYYEIRYCGPRNNFNWITGQNETAVRGVRGRYPDHIHLMREGGRGVVRRGMIVRDSGNSGSRPHGSDGVTLEDCNFYNCRVGTILKINPQTDGPQPELADAIIDWDRADITGNPNTERLLHATNDLTVRRCFVGLIRRDPGSGGSSGEFAGISIGEGVNNAYEDNECCGCTGSTFASQLSWPPGAATDDRGIGIFRGRTYLHNGLQGARTWQNPNQQTLTHHVPGFVVFNVSTGIDHGAYANTYDYDGTLVSGCTHTGIRQHSHSFPLAGSPPMRYRDGIVDVQGLADQCYRAVDRNPASTAEIEHLRMTYRGYRRWACFFGRVENATGRHSVPKRERFINCNFGPGVALWLTNEEATGTLIRVQPDPRTGTGAVALRPFDQAGEFYAPWNACVTTIPPFA